MTPADRIDLQARKRDSERKLRKWMKLSPEEQRRRLAQHSYNALLGHVRRAQQAGYNVMRHSWASPRAKTLAEKIENLARELDAELRSNRRSPSDA